MLTVLFWNVGGKALETPLVSMVRRYAVDVVILAECPWNDPSLALLLSSAGQFHPPHPTVSFDILRILTRDSIPRPLLRREFTRYLMLTILPPGAPELILVATHLPSKRHRSADGQMTDQLLLGHSVREMETLVGHERTILMGDLNANPFEPGVVAATGLQAVMNRQLARVEGRILDGIRYPYFYNPMWGYYGDETHAAHPPGTPNHRPSGSCYYPAADPVWYYWNLYDQVLLRPALIASLLPNSVRLLTEEGPDRFLGANGRPNRTDYSDHLPLVVTLNV
jgi:hypothetical protein